MTVGTLPNPLTWRGAVSEDAYFRLAKRDFRILATMCIGSTTSAISYCMAAPRMIFDSLAESLWLHSRPPCQRLPSSLLIESASARALCCSTTTLAEALPIKANDEAG